MCVKIYNHTTWQGSSTYLLTYIIPHLAGPVLSYYVSHYIYIYYRNAGYYYIIVGQILGIPRLRH